MYANTLTVYSSTFFPLHAFMFFLIFTGQRFTGKGSVGHERSVRARDPSAGQKASSRDENQTTHAEPAMERDLLLRRISDSEAAIARPAFARLRLRSILQGRFDWRGLSTIMSGTYVCAHNNSMRSQSKSAEARASKQIFMYI